MMKAVKLAARGFELTDGFEKAIRRSLIPRRAAYAQYVSLLGRGLALGIFDSRRVRQSDKEKA